MRRALVLALLLGACGDDPKRKLGSTCESDAQCESGFCAESVCLEPQADSDGDGILNVIERGLGTSVKLADTDGDSLSDADELGDDVNAPRDSDGDGLIDARESELADADGDCVADQADPADDDATVPGDMCEPPAPGATMRVSAADREARNGDVANLVGGGFVASWNEGRTPTTPDQAGRLVAFFSASGAELKRFAVDVNQGYYRYEKSIIGLRDGDAAIGAWHMSATTAEFSTQRYSATGDPLGSPVLVVPDDINATGVRLIAHTEGNYGVVYIGDDSVLTIRFIDTGNQLSPAIGGRALRGQDARFDAVGMNGGATVVVSREPGATGGPDALTAKLFDNSGAQTNADVVVQSKPTRDVRVANLGDGVMVFFLEDSANTMSIGYQAYDQRMLPVGETLYLVQNDADGCPLDLVAGLDALEQPFAAVIDEECRSPIRGWLQATSGVVPLAIAPAAQVDDQYSLRATRSEGPPLFMYLHDPAEGQGGVYLTRFGSDGKATAITTAP